MSETQDKKDNPEINEQEPPIVKKIKQDNQNHKIVTNQNEECKKENSDKNIIEINSESEENDKKNKENNKQEKNENKEKKNDSKTNQKSQNKSQKSSHKKQIQTNLMFMPQYLQDPQQQYLLQQQQLQLMYGQQQYSQLSQIPYPILPQIYQQQFAQQQQFTQQQQQQQKQQQQQQNQNQQQKQDNIPQIQLKGVYKKEYHTRKCSACKKLDSVLGCSKCQKAYHLHCVGIKSEEEIPQKFYCDKCQQEREKTLQLKEKEKKKRQKERELEQQILQFQVSQQLNLQKIQKQIPMVINITLFIVKQIYYMFKQQLLKQSAFTSNDRISKLKKQKDKKQEEYNIKFEQFSKDYPQFVENKKIKFPIDDMLLTLNSDLFPNHQNTNSKPEFKQYSYIEPKYLSDILLIWNFFKTFQINLGEIKLDIEEIYLTLTWQDEKPLELINKMHIELLNFYLDDLFEKKKIDYKEIQEIPFYQLIRYLQDSNELDPCLSYTWTEYIYNMQFFPDFLDIILVFLISCVQETESFRKLMQENQDNLVELIKEKNDLHQEIRKEDTEIKQMKLDLQIQEKGINEKSNQVQDTEQLSRQESLKISKELDKEKKEFAKKQRQYEKLENEIENKKERVEQLQQEIPFYLNNVVNLGKDAEKQQYWFFANDDCKIYVQPNLIENNSEMYVIDTKEDINQLRSSLNKYGVREKNLLKNIDYLIDNKHMFFTYHMEDRMKSKDEIKRKKEEEKNKDNKEEKKSEEVLEVEAIELDNEEQQDEEETRKKEELEKQKQIKISNILSYNDEMQNITQFYQQNKRQTRGQVKMKQQQETQELSLELVRDIVFYTEQLFTTYLEKKSSRWETYENRQKIKQKLRAKGNLSVKTIAEVLKSLSEGFSLSQMLSLDDNAEISETEQNENINIQNSSNNNSSNIKKKINKKQIDSDNNMEDEQESSEEQMFQAQKNKNQEKEKAQQNHELSINKENEQNEKEEEKKEQQNDSKMESEDEQEKLFQQEEEEYKNSLLYQLESNPNLKTKKVPLRIWTTATSETIKLYWDEYEENNLVQIYIKTFIFCKLVSLYVERKMEKLQKQEQNQNNQYPTQQYQQQQQQYQQPEKKTRARNNQNKSNLAINTRQKQKKNYYEGDSDDFDDFEEEEIEENDQQSEESQIDSEIEQEEEALDLEEENSQNSKINQNYSSNNNNNDSLNSDSQEDDDESQSGSKKLIKKRLQKIKDKKSYKKTYNTDEAMKSKQNKIKQLLHSKNTSHLSKNRHAVNQNQWDDKCKKCGDYGDVICCNTCTSVYHLKCLKLKEVPQGKWSCMDCLNKLAIKQASTRSTRSQNKPIY
ncbi:Zinc finger, FYVE/PHD-type [Pseudocohnilembus persalinus]|uniref:Zinc finger, FYVE/PHD-type n=1 Tax=Pseudocohnilembus persalinus TaxID=266149 RepID=A0A0V0QQQ3_PSEPJ|nr:Zinc finger, FYVE/PHD-type [Pseudocohnilembus persalinus]|eukprot:KRX04344.1 Zinc finger, FYVE/PHD-type [Pseudocohnilembus persalinus]